MVTELDKDPNVSSVSGSATLSDDQKPEGPNADEFTPEGGVKEAEQQEAKKAAEKEAKENKTDSGGTE